MSSLAEADAAFFRNQPQESEPLPTTDKRCTECGGGLRWDGFDGQNIDFWVCPEWHYTETARHDATGA